METKELTTRDIYEILGDSRDKIRAFFGIAVDVLDIEDDVITVRVEQEKLVNNYVLNQSELVNRAGQLFEKIKGYRLRFKPLTYRPDFDKINADWVNSKMQEFKVKNNDLVKHTGIDKHEISRLINGLRDLTKAQKALFFFYFMQYELNRDFREQL